MLIFLWSADSYWVSVFNDASLVFYAQGSSQSNSPAGNNISY